MAGKYTPPPSRSDYPFVVNEKKTIDFILDGKRIDAMVAYAAADNDVARATAEAKFNSYMDEDDLWELERAGKAANDVLHAMAKDFNKQNPALMSIIAEYKADLNPQTRQACFPSDDVAPVRAGIKDVTGVGRELLKKAAGKYETTITLDIPKKGKVEVPITGAIILDLERLMESKIKTKQTSSEAAEFYFRASMMEHFTGNIADVDKDRLANRLEKKGVTRKAYTDALVLEANKKEDGKLPALIEAMVTELMVDIDTEKSRRVSLRGVKPPRGRA